MRECDLQHGCPMTTITKARAHAPRVVVALAIGGAALLAGSSSARAQSTINTPNPPKYSVEIEPQLNFGPADVYGYGGTGFGPGVRFSIPLMSPGFVKSINDSVAISFGLDLVHYSGYRYFANDCNRFGCANAYDAGDFWAAYFPVTMQWNFWLSDRWSVFGEPGIAFRHSFYGDTYCDSRFYSCGHRDDVFFAFFAGGRFALSDKVALTMRIGHPILFSLGLSLFP